MLTQTCNVLLGLWLMVAPDVFGYRGTPADNDRIVGPLVITFAAVAMAQATRAVRWANWPLGLWLILSAWVLGYPSNAAIITTLVGGAIVACSVPRGRRVHRLGGGWRFLWS